MKRRHPESDLQAAVAQLLNVYEAQGKLVWAPVPNGMKVAGGTLTDRARRVKMLKDKGQLRPGVSDILICLHGGHYAAIELKAEGGRATADQKDFLYSIQRMGGLFEVCKSVDAVKTTIDRWLALTRRAAA